MAKFIYDLSIDRPEDLPITMVNSDLIGVWCGDISYGTTQFDGSGTLYLELPDPVIKRINHGFLKVVPTFRKIGKDGDPTRDLQELVQIDVLPST